MITEMALRKRFSIKRLRPGRLQPYPSTITLTDGNTDIFDGFSQTVPGYGDLFRGELVVLGVAMTSLVKQRQGGYVAPVWPQCLCARSDIIGGKILAYFLIGVVQFLIVFAVGVVVGLNFGNDPVALVLLGLTLYAVHHGARFCAGPSQCATNRR